MIESSFVASTTHGRITPEARAAAGLGEGLLRVAVGLEALEDIKADLARGLRSTEREARSDEREVNPFRALRFVFYRLTERQPEASHFR